MTITRRQFLQLSGGAAATAWLSANLLVERNADAQSKRYCPVKDPFKPSEELKKLVADSISRATKPEDKLGKLHEALNTDTGALAKQSQAGRRPRSAEEPLGLGRDCSEFALVFVSALDILGITSGLAVGNIKGRKEGHVVATATVAGKEYLLDPQSDFNKTIEGFDASAARRLDRASSGSIYYREWGDYLLDQKDYANAATAFETAKSLDPNSAYIWNGLGFAYERIGKKDEAQECYKMAAKLDASGDKAIQDNASRVDYNELMEKAEKLVAEKDWKGALALYEKAIELQPERPIPQAGAGLCHFNLGEYKDAAKHFETAYKMTKDPQIKKYWDEAKKRAAESK